MRNMKLYFSLLLCLLAGSPAAQIPTNTIGANPFGLKWQQINTDKVQIIFPKGNEVRAQRVANLAHYLWDHHNDGIGDKQIKATILLQNQTVIPNGFVTVGPFRSEFFLTPPQFNVATDWLDHLTIHEYRHIKQFGNSRRGLTQAARYVFGSWIWGGFAATALPRWFFEGDATVQETALTSTGRGRLPAFTMEQRSLILDDIDYGYEKAAAGSLRDFVPNWYSLGYYMVSYGRERFGADLWQGVVNDAVRYKGLFNPFSKGLKEKTGLSTKEMYRAMRQDLEEKWSADAAARSSAPLPPVNTQARRTVIHYTNPRWLDNERLVVEKRGYNQLPAYYTLSLDGREERLTSAGPLLNPPETTLSLGNQRLVWAEFGFDLRRSLQTYSVVRTYDMVSGSKRFLTTESKYFSPDITRQGDRIAVVETTADGLVQLVILDAADGRRLQTFLASSTTFYLYPRWTPDGKSIALIVQERERHSLQLLDLESGTLRALTPALSDQLSHPTVGDDFIYFAAAYTGVNQIYAVRTSGGPVYRVSDDPLGAFQPAVSPDGQQLAYAAFRRTGFDIVTLALDPAQWETVDPAGLPRLPTYAEAIAEQEGGSIVGAVGNQTFPVTKFNKLSGLFNVHSWLPELDPPIVGARILSDNKFGTLSADAGALYNLNENEWTLSADLRYAELFPVIELGYRHQNRAARLINYRPETDSTIRFASYVEYWQENKIRAGLDIPLNLSQGNAIHRLNLSAHYEYFDVTPEGNVDDPDLAIDTVFVVGPNRSHLFNELFREPLAGTSLNALDLRLRWRLFRRQALQHLAPRWGLITDARYRTTIGNEQFSGYDFTARADLYLPGLSRNHAFYFNSAYQNIDRLNNYRFANFFTYSRGYRAIGADEVFKIGINYSVPLAYPDWAFGSFAFLKRLKINAFADYGLLNWDREFRSVGAELRVDFRALRLVEVDLGLRYSYLLDPVFAHNGRAHQFDFLLISISE